MRHKPPFLSVVSDAQALPAFAEYLPVIRYESLIDLILIRPPAAEITTGKGNGEISVLNQLLLRRDIETQSAVIQES